MITEQVAMLALSRAQVPQLALLRQLVEEVGSAKELLENASNIQDILPDATPKLAAMLADSSIVERAERERQQPEKIKNGFRNEGIHTGYLLLSSAIIIQGLTHFVKLILPLFRFLAIKKGFRPL